MDTERPARWHTGLAAMPTAVRLPIATDVAALHRDLDVAKQRCWVGHFNAGYFEGEWSGIVLRGRDGDLVPGQTVDPLLFTDTPVLDQCPAFRAVLAALRCPLLSVRLLRLTPGSVIREHSDWDLSTEHDVVRLHVALRTNPDVEFYVNHERVVLREGECWYLDLSKPHRVQNLGSTDRVHLVIDCVANEWLRALIASGDVAGDSEQRPFDQFSALVWQHRELRDALIEASAGPEFVATAVQLATQYGHRITADDVRSAQRQTRSEWAKRYCV